MSIKNISFPECYDNCELVKYLGVGECESCCPWKFDKNGNSIKQSEEENKNEQKILQTHRNVRQVMQCLSKATET